MKKQKRKHKRCIFCLEVMEPLSRHDWNHKNPNCLFGPSIVKGDTEPLVLLENFIAWTWVFKPYFNFNPGTLWKPCRQYDTHYCILTHDC
jgi:hypothetical protein